MAQTINVASIKIGMDVEEIKKNGMFTRSEISSIARLARESTDPVDKYVSEIQKLERAYKTGGLSGEAFARMQERVAAKSGMVFPVGSINTYTAKMTELKARLDAGSISSEQFRQQQLKLQQTLGIVSADIAKQSQAIKEKGSAVASIKNLAASYVGLAAAIQGVRASIKLASEMEQASIAFEVMTKSASTSQMLLSEFKRLDVNSPISYADFARAGKTLLQFGVSVQAVSPTLERLSAISLGNAEQFQSLALAFGQVQANGRLMGQEVLQMVNAGFNPLQEISRTTGVSMVELKKRMEAGAISADMVANAFRTATTEGGLFFGMNEKLSKSLAGQYAKLEGDIKATGIQLGTTLIPLLSEAAGLARDLAGGGAKENAVSFNIKLIADSYAALFAGIREGSFDAAINYRSNLIDAELDRQAEIQRSINQEKERAAATANTAEEAKKLAEASQAESDRVAKMTAVIELNKKRAEDFRSMRDELDKLTMSQEAYNRKKREEQGFTAQDTAIAEGFDKAIEAARQRKAIAEEVAKIERDSMTERQKAMEEINRLQALFGAMSAQDQASIRGLRIQQQQELVAKRFAESEASKLAPNIAPAIKAGTVEAYKFMLSQQQKNRDQEEVKRIQTDMLTEMRKANELAATAPRLAGAR